MTTSGEVKSIDWEEDGEPVADGVRPDAKLPAGRIVHDERGNALWKWRGDASSTGTGSGILKHLDARDLSVEGQDSQPASVNTPRPRISDAGGGYDPYDQSPKKKR